MIDGYWLPVRDGDPRALAIYLRHYSSRKSRAGHQTTLIGNYARFVGNGEHQVLLTRECDALLAWRLQAFRSDDQAGVECTVFRKEGGGVASDMIAEAVTIAQRRWPGQRLFTFVDPRHVRSANPGYCFKVAGFRRCGYAKRGLHILELLLELETAECPPRARPSMPSTATRRMPSCTGSLRSTGIRSTRKRMPPCVASRRYPTGSPLARRRANCRASTDCAGRAHDGLRRKGETHERTPAARDRASSRPGSPGESRQSRALQRPTA